MKKLIAILILAMFCMVSVSTEAYAAKNNKGKRHVKSYIKKNGTHVRAHSKTVHYGHKKRR